MCKILLPNFLIILLSKKGVSCKFFGKPVSSQLLYFHLNMRADDDGFVANPKKIVRMLNAGTDDLKVLIGKKFIIAFEDGVCVIKHWRINNFIRKDIYKETKYLDLKRRS